MIKKILLLGLLSQNIALAETAIPDVIKVPESNTALMTLHATGDQIYQCALKDNKYQWIVYPKAVLMDNGQIVGKHGKGPSWQYKDGSQVIGKIIQKTEEARTVAMPWLLIEVVTHKGNGVLSAVSYINRVNTQGGLEPTQVCDSNHLGSEHAAPYTADYIFYAN